MMQVFIYNQQGLSIAGKINWSFTILMICLVKMRKIIKMNENKMMTKNSEK